MANVQTWTNRIKLIGVPLEKAAAKGEDGTMVVRGFFTSDNKDEVGDIITRSATERAIPKYRQWGNIRYMHMPKPVAKVVRIGVEDGLAWNEVEIKVIDPQAVFEVENELLQALSIGAMIRFEDVDFLEDGGLIINDYTLAEISLVDHPANYDAYLQGAKDILCGLADCEGQEKTLARIDDFRRAIMPAQEEPMPEADKDIPVIEPEPITEPEPVAEPEPVVTQPIERAAEEDDPAEDEQDEPMPDEEPMDEPDPMMEILNSLVQSVQKQTELLTQLIEQLSKPASLPVTEVPAEAPVQEQPVDGVDKGLPADEPVEPEPGSPVRKGAIPSDNVPGEPPMAPVEPVAPKTLRDVLRMKFVQTAQPK